MLKPEQLDMDLCSTQVTVEFSHWYNTFTHDLNALRTTDVKHTK